ncbi:MAG: nickel pincer cofactor biosynthesis protein LarB [bacterium]|nr:nickel pincer cofactor biosynthesis protein LarB [bacterium]
MMPDENNELRALLERVRRGEQDIDDALAHLQSDAQPLPPAAELGFATVDHERASRCGFPEVVFCSGKTPPDAATIAAEILTRADRVLLTRASSEHAAAVRERVPAATYHERARCITVAPAMTATERHGHVAVIAAGTSDLAVADEAAVTLEIAGNRIERYHDIGVAGLHRLTAKLEAIRRADVAVAVAGMEGALPSVLAGLVDFPVIAVPTSVGYGASYGGLTALLAMLNSCAAGVAVVNIDNGFGAGYLASLINRRAASGPPSQTP